MRKKHRFLSDSQWKEFNNGVNTMEELRKCVKCVKDLDKDKKFYMGFSSVIIRPYRNLVQEIRDLNLKLKRYCEGNNLFVDNVNIEEPCLNNSKLHLNHKGTNILCQNIKNYIYIIIKVQGTSVKLISLI